MPCDLLAVSTSRISKLMLLKELAPDVLASVLKTALANLLKVSATEMHAVIYKDSVVVEERGYSIALDTFNGKITVSGGRSESYNAQVAEKLSQAVEQAGGIVFQKRAAQVVAKKFPVLEKKKLGTAIELTIEV